MSGGGGIRTHEGLRPAGFQDRSHQPLDHPSQIPRPITALIRQSVCSNIVRQSNAPDGVSVRRATEVLRDQSFAVERLFLALERVFALDIAYVQKNVAE
jgi:hypothetical protein